MFKSIMVFVGVFLSWFLLLSGCNTTQKTDVDQVYDPQPQIEESKKLNEEVKNEITNQTDKTIKEADKIKGEANTIQKKVPNKVDDEVDKINQHADNIITFQKILQEQNNKLDQSNAKLTNAMILVNELSKQKSELLESNKKLEKEKEQAQREKQEALFQKMIYLIIASVILGALCLVSALRGETKAIWGAVVAGIVMITALAISFFSVQFAYVGLIAIIAGLALACYIGYTNYVERKANKELVHTVEIAKDKLNERDKRELFGEGVNVGHAHNIQSQSTSNLVNKLREREKKFWEHTIKN